MQHVEEMKKKNEKKKKKKQKKEVVVIIDDDDDDCYANDVIVVKFDKELQKVIVVDKDVVVVVEWGLIIVDTAEGFD